MNLRLDNLGEKTLHVLHHPRTRQVSRWGLLVVSGGVGLAIGLSLPHGAPKTDTEVVHLPVLDSCEDALMHAAKASTADQRLDKLRAAADALAADLVEAQMSLDPDRIEEAFEPLRENAEERKRWENTRSEQRSLMGQRANDCRNGVR